MRTRRFAAALSGLVIMLVASGQAPRGTGSAQPPAPAPSRAIEGGPAAFDGELMRLAEILGALHYLRALCGANEGPKWREQMQALLDAEAQSGERRSRLTANFNRGYRDFQQTYRSCTPAATVAVRRYLDEGAKISRDITARYTN